MQSESPVGPDVERGYGILGTEGWKDTDSKAYKDELEALLRAQRAKEYAQLSTRSFEGLVQHVRKCSRA